MYYTYMVRCKDNSIYTGITTDIERRFNEHISKDEKCAKYTLNHTVIKLEAVWQSETRSQASKLEYYIKTLKKEQKENIIKNPKEIETYLKNRLDCSNYIRISL